MHVNKAWEIRVGMPSSFCSLPKRQQFTSSLFVCVHTLSDCVHISDEDNFGPAKPWHRAVATPSSAPPEVSCKEAVRFMYIHFPFRLCGWTILPLAEYRLCVVDTRRRCGVKGDKSRRPLTTRMYHQYRTR